MNEPKPRFTLTTEEKLSPLWKKLMAHWEDRLSHIHVQLEGDGPDSTTYKLRGKAAEIRTNLALNKDPIQH